MTAAELPELPPADDAPPVATLDGHPITWRPWHVEPRVFICPPPRTPDACPECGQHPPHLTATGLADGVIAVTAQRCRACGYVEVDDIRDLPGGGPVEIPIPQQATSPPISPLHDADYGATKTARANRALKARDLENHAWHAALTPADLLTLDEAARRRLARGAGHNPPSPGSPTWDLVLERLQARTEWAAANPGDPRAARSAPDRARYGLPDTSASDRHAAVPRGWDTLAALGPLGPPTGCTIPVANPAGGGRRPCGQPAIAWTTMRSGPPAARCEHHPPGPTEWGATLDWTPRRCRAPAICWCPRCPHRVS